MAGHAAPAPGRDRPAQPPDVHRRRRRAHRPAELPRPRPRPRRLALRHRARLGAARRAPAARRRRQAARRPGHAAAAAALAGRHRHATRTARPPGSVCRSRRSRSGCGAPPATARAARLRQRGASRTTSPAGRTRPGSSTRTARGRSRQAARGGRPVRAGLRQRAPGRLPLPATSSTSGGACPEASHPQLQMDDYGGNRGANVDDPVPELRRQAQHQRGHGPARRGEPARCRGRHPHLGDVRAVRAERAEAARGRRIQPVVRADPLRAGRAADRRQRAADQGRAAVGRPAERDTESRDPATLPGRLPAVPGPAPVEQRRGLGRHRAAPQGAGVRRRRRPGGLPGSAHPGVGDLLRRSSRPSHRRLHAPPRPRRRAGRAGRSSSPTSSRPSGCARSAP